MEIFNKDVTVLGGLTLSLTNATGNILTIDGTGIARFRTPSEVLADIGAATAAQGASADTAFSWGDHNGLYSLLGHTHTIANITNLQASLDGKVDDGQVLTNVPAGAVFTDTVYTLPFADNSANWNTAFGWGDHAGLYASTSQGVLADNSVQLTGDESIDGVKTFLKPVTIIGDFLGTSIGRGINIDLTGLADGRHIPIAASYNSSATDLANGLSGFTLSNRNQGANNYVSYNFATEDTNSVNRVFGNMAVQFVNHSTTVGKADYVFNLWNNTSLEEAARLKAGGTLYVKTALGVGTSTPSSQLHVSSSTVGETGVRIDTLGTGNSYSVLRLMEDNTTTKSLNLHYISGTYTTTGLTRPNSALILTGSGATGGMIFNTQASAPIIFGTSSIERMQINSSGNVAINKTTATEKLDVNGNVKATSFIGSGSSLTGVASSAQGVLADNSVQLTGETSQQIDGNITVKGGLYTNHIGQITNALAVTANSNDVFLSLYRRTVQGSADILIRTSGNSYFNGGNVGIGTTSPSEALDVVGKIALNDGGGNVFIGTNAGSFDDGTPKFNVGVGYRALFSNTSGVFNTANGSYALYLNTTGERNTSDGYQSLYSNTTGYYNAANGYRALFANTTGFRNTALGFQAGTNTNALAANQTSNNSVYLGNDTRSSASGNTNEIVIGSTAEGNGSNTVTLGNDSITDTYLKGNIIGDVATAAQGVLADNSVQLTGSQTIIGSKTFNAGVVIDNNRLRIKNAGTNIIEFFNSIARDAYFGRIVGAGIRTVNEIGGGQFTIKDDGAFDFNGDVTAASFIGDGSTLTGIATEAQGLLADNSVQLTGETSQSIDGNLLVNGILKTTGNGLEGPLFGDLRFRTLGNSDSEGFLFLDANNLAVASIFRTGAAEFASSVSATEGLFSKKIGSGTASDNYQNQLGSFYLTRGDNRPDVFNDRIHYVSTRTDTTAIGNNIIFNIDDGSTNNGTSHVEALKLDGAGAATFSGVTRFKSNANQAMLLFPTLAPISTNLAFQVTDQGGVAKYSITWGGNSSQVGNSTAANFIGSGSQLTEVVKTSGSQEVGGFKRFTNDIALANTDVINTLKTGRLDGYTYAQSSRFIGMYVVGLSGSNNVVIGGGTGGAKSATQITFATNSDPEALSSTNRVLINHLKAEFFVPIIGDGSQLTGVASAAQGILANTAIQNTDLQLSQKFTSFGESYVNNFRSSMLDLGDEFFTSSAGYQIGKNKQLGLNPSLQMLPISGQAGKLRSIGSNRVNDFTVARNSTATYIDEDGLIKTASANVPRFDYSEGLDPSLLLEPQSTNLITYSEDISNSSWSFINVDKNLIQLKNPSGTLGVYEIASNSNNTTHFIETTAYNATSGVDYTFSFFAKINGSNFVQVALSTGFSSLYQNFNLLDGTLGNGNLTSGYSSSIEPFDNGWYRISVKGNTISANARFLTVPILTDIASRNPSFSGDGSLGVYAWGFQKEQSSFASSYIPTSGTTVTRLADVVDNTGISDFIGQTEGTIFIKVKIDSEISNFSDIINFGRNTTNTINISRIHSIKKLRFSLYAGGSIVFNMDSSATTELGEELKLAITYKSGGSKMYLNGVQSNSLSSTFAFSALLNEININDSVLYFANQQVESVYSLEVYKTALTDAELTELTTL